MATGGFAESLTLIERERELRKIAKKESQQENTQKFQFAVQQELFTKTLF